MSIRYLRSAQHDITAAFNTKDIKVLHVVVVLLFVFTVANLLVSIRYAHAVVKVVSILQHPEEMNISSSMTGKLLSSHQTSEPASLELQPKPMTAFRTFQSELKPDQSVRKTVGLPHQATHESKPTAAPLAEARPRSRSGRTRTRDPRPDSLMLKSFPDSPAEKASRARSKEKSTSSKGGQPTPTSSPFRPQECRDCFRHEYKYVIQNESICRHNKSDVIDLLLLITTVHRNTKARQALRDTWLSVARGNRGNVRYVFLLGENFNSTTRKELLVENRKYGDLIMEDFKDAYLNLTLKTLMGFKWASTFCPQARFVMKTDDDMWVNIKSVLRLLKVHEKRLQTNMGGQCSSRSKPIRNKKSKWYASKRSFPQDTYEGFCSGTGYVTSMKVVKKVYALSPSVPFFHLEDVYVGLCLRKLGFGLVTLPGFHGGGTPHKACHMQSAAIVTSHRVKPETLVEMWNGKCAKSTI